VEVSRVRNGASQQLPGTKGNVHWISAYQKENDDTVSLQAETPKEVRWRQRLLKKGAAFVRGVAAGRAGLPRRVSRAEKIAVGAMSTLAAAGAAVGAVLGGPVGFVAGAALGTAASSLVAAALLMPGWPIELCKTIKEPKRPAPGTDVNLVPSTDTPLLGKGVQRRLDFLCKAETTDGNKVKLMLSGPWAFAERNHLFENAKKSINLQTYIFHDDETGWNTAKILADKARQGVEVRVLVDGVGTSDTDSKIFHSLREAGAEVVEFCPPTQAVERLNTRWHQKIVTVDDEAAIVGGMNVGSEYAYTGTGRVDVSKGTSSASASWLSDADALITGPAATKIGQQFNENWRLATLELLPDPAPQAENGDGVTTRFISQLPYEKGETTINQWYLEMLKNARDTAYIANAYFVPDGELLDAMCDAAKRGVDVRVLTNSQESSDHAIPMVVQAARSTYERLLEAGVRVYEAKSPGDVLRVLHKKTAVFDGMVSAVGSYNLDPRSAKLNSECMLEVQGQIHGSQMLAQFARDLRRSREVRKKDLYEGTVLDRLEQWFYGGPLKGLT